MAASPRSWDFLLLPLRELPLPLLRGGRVERRGRQLNQSRILFFVATGSLKFLAAHRLLFVAMFRLFCGSRAIARDAETNNDRGEHGMSHFVFPPSAWFSQLTIIRRHGAVYFLPFRGRSRAKGCVQS
jgi:hypothetical protein